MNLIEQKSHKEENKPCVDITAYGGILHKCAMRAPLYICTN